MGSRLVETAEPYRINVVTLQFSPIEFGFYQECFIYIYIYIYINTYICVTLFLMEQGSSLILVTVVSDGRSN